MSFKHLRRLSQAEVPGFAQDELSSILSELTRYGAAVDQDGKVFKTAVDHTLSRIQNRTGRNIAIRIYDLHLRIRQDD